jgi:hypothetical protein
MCMILHHDNTTDLKYSGKQITTGFATITALSRLKFSFELISPESGFLQPLFYTVYTKVIKFLS